MSAPLLIGLTGPAGSGKDSAADALVHLAGFTKVAFADALRAEVCAAFGVPLQYLTARDTKEHPIQALALSRCMVMGFLATLREQQLDLDEDAPRSARQIMQWWGTEFRRARDENYWIARAVQRIKRLHKQGKSVVLTDVRFPNEADAIRALGGVVWQVWRPGAEVAEGAHASETHGREFGPEYVIDNDEGLDELRIEVAATLAHMKEFSA